MTEQGSDWNDPARVDRWVARDAHRPAVQTARDLAVAIVGFDTQPARVLELAAGAGSFLATFLSAFPHAQGMWSDSSAEMARHARTTLAPFSDRVGYVVTDMREPALPDAAHFDVVVCARATHSLGTDELAPFYCRTAALLSPGGWLINLDHMAVDEPWASRYDRATPRFYDGTDAPPSRKERGGHGLGTHLSALAAAGFTEADVPWRLLSTVLLLARRPDRQAGRRTSASDAPGASP